MQPAKILGTIKLTDLVKKFELKQVNNVNYEDTELHQPKVNRPALPITGFFDFFDKERIQVIGMVEYTYLSRKSSEERAKIYEKLCSYKVPAIVVSRGFGVFDELQQSCEKYNIPIFVTDAPTTDFINDITRWLRTKLAATTTIHGVLVDIYGEGVLITGESGIGKSEAALELIKRGHRLVADDSVIIKKVSNSTLVGTSPEIIRYFIELRGIGIINVRHLFGVESVKLTQQIDLVIDLKQWSKDAEYDRLGLEDKYTEILGNKIVCQDIPIRPGRNIAIICEAAAVNHRQKKMGYNAAVDLNERVMNNIAQNNNDNVFDDYDVNRRFDV